MTSNITSRSGPVNANGVVNAKLKDNAGRRGNKREKIKRVPFNSRVRFHNSDPEISVRSVWEESLREAVDLVRMLNAYVCVCGCVCKYIYVNIIAEATDHERTTVVNEHS